MPEKKLKDRIVGVSSLLSRLIDEKKFSTEEKTAMILAAVVGFDEGEIGRACFELYYHSNPRKVDAIIDEMEAPFQQFSERIAVGIEIRLGPSHRR